MTAVRGHEKGCALRPVAAPVLAAVTTVVAHWLITGVAPGPEAVLLGLVLAGAVVTVMFGRTSTGPLAAVLVAQLVFQVVFAVMHPVGCLRAVGRAAWAGGDLVAWAVSSGCAPSQLFVAGSTQRVALVALVSVVPLLVGHVVAALVGAAGVARAEDAARAVLALLGAVLVRLPSAVRLLVARPLMPAPASERVLQTALTPLRSLARRGPPPVVPA